MLVLPFFVTSVHCAEPTLAEILNNLGFTNITESTIEIFPAGLYEIILYAEFAGYHATNELSSYPINTSDFTLIFSGPEGNSGYITPPINKTFLSNDTFGLSLYVAHESHRYFTEHARNPDGQNHSKVYQSLDGPDLYFIGFENIYGLGDRDYNDMVFSLQPIKHYLTVETEPPGITTILGQGWHNYCTNVTLTAPDTVPVSTGVRYSFSHWVVNNISQGNGVNPITVHMDANHTTTAHYILQYYLTLTWTTGGVTDPSTSDWYDNGTTVEVTAVPDTCYEFDHWKLDGTPVGSANPYPVLMDANHTLHAVFAHINYTLTITSTSGGTTDPLSGTYTYPCCSVVEVTAIPDPCYEFDHWELDGTPVGSASPILVHIDRNVTLHVVFTRITYELTITTTAGGTTNPAPGVYLHPCNSTIEVTAIPDTNYDFYYWILDDVPVGSSNPYPVLMDEDHTIHAVFRSSRIVGGATVSMKSHLFNTWISLNIMLVVAISITASWKKRRRRKTS